MLLQSGKKWEKVGDNMLIGEYHHNIDEKGRLIIPSKFREEIGNSFVVTRGLDGCLFVYSLVEWEKIIAKLKKLPFTKKDARVFIRSFFSGATECEFDRQGRINITSPLVGYADLTKECVIIGANDHLEVWGKANWDNFFTENSEKLEDIAENLFNELDI